MLSGPAGEACVLSVAFLFPAFYFLPPLSSSGHVVHASFGVSRRTERFVGSVDAALFLYVCVSVCVCVRACVRVCVCLKYCWC